MANSAIDNEMRLIDFFNAEKHACSLTVVAD
jgi:hypothetical protein